MSNYLIGIGGSGAKCVEAFIHLGAAGLMAGPARARCKTLFVDPDTANGSLGKAQTTLQAYLNAATAPLGVMDAFSLQIGTFDKRVWSPLPEHESRTLEAFFGYRDPRPEKRATARFMDVLFSPAQIEMDLNEGFRGNPAIGAAVFGGTVNLAKEEPWREMYSLIKQDAANAGGASVLLVGSVFGGTGASGVPTIARIVADDLERSEIKNVRIGAVLLLPYFSFGEVKDAALQAKTPDFLPNTRIALDYYYDRRYLDILQAVYLLGEHQLSSVAKASIGGRDQTNFAHPMEMNAALAAVDFFRHPKEAKGCMVAAREAQDAISWRDLPAPLDINMRTRVGQFVRFAYAYLAMCYRSIMTYVNTRDDQNTVWIKQFFPRKSTVDFPAVAALAEHLRIYCESFLLWIGEMQHTSAQAGIPLGLAWTDRFVDIAGDPPSVQIRTDLPKNFNSLVLPSAREGLQFQQIYEALGNARPVDTNAAAGFGQLINELYRLCGDRFK